MTHDVKIWLFFCGIFYCVGSSLVIRSSSSPHQPCQFRDASQKAFMIVASIIGSCSMNPPESPSAQLSNEGMELFHHEVFRNDGHEFLFVDDLPGSPVRLVEQSKLGCDATCNIKRDDTIGTEHRHIIQLNSYHPYNRV